MFALDRLVTFQQCFYSSYEGIVHKLMIVYY